MVWSASAERACCKMLNLHPGVGQLFSPARARLVRRWVLALIRPVALLHSDRICSGRAAENTKHTRNTKSQVGGSRLEALLARDLCRRSQHCRFLQRVQNLLGSGSCFVFSSCLSFVAANYKNFLPGWRGRCSSFHLKCELTLA